MKTLHTERLTLRPWTMDDAEALFDYAHTDLVGPAAGWKPHETIDDTRDYLAHCIQNDETWAIVYEPDHYVVGSVGLHKTARPEATQTRELGYVMNPRYWNRGIMHEAIEAVLSFAFTEMKLLRVIVCHFSENARSKKVILGSGFRYEGALHDATVGVDGALLTLCMYAMTKDEWAHRDATPPNYAFIQNRGCAYFPCHKTENSARFNCLFCYCPLYLVEDCGGNWVYTERGVKDCSNCLFPHYNYDGVIQKLCERNS